MTIFNPAVFANLNYLALTQANHTSFQVLGKFALVAAAIAAWNCPKFTRHDANRPLFPILVNKIFPASYNLYS